eukprot:gnl/MRDRNA2_/MRDRNA2_96020_c0_seq1.p1 gnl/MRDRNA2_/MRDRNA2_96020_c0~~gnl/MRDRNA2_/MRDRNA2_96020_c0_seq1.p1  ORF type:complete len:289 (+),score=42.08 gnl/MRDRNA2_/MRDRNA2_96020_c0_seq1:70-936(+)
MQYAAAFIAGGMCKSNCTPAPCTAGACEMHDGSRPFKLSIRFLSAYLQELDKPGLMQNQRPSVSVAVADRTKETEPGDWAKDPGEWRFNEALTLEVFPSSELTFAVNCSTRYDLLVASVSFRSTQMGEARCPVDTVLTRLRPEDRDTEGMCYASPVMTFEVVQTGKVTGRLRVSFETQQCPPLHKLMGRGGHLDRWCSWAGSGGPSYAEADDESDWEGPCRAGRLDSRSESRGDWSVYHHSESLPDTCSKGVESKWGNAEYRSREACKEETGSHRSRVGHQGMWRDPD